MIALDLQTFGGSALTDRSIDVPTQGAADGIPVTYVPARNTIFLSLALAWAEVLDAGAIFISANAVDYSGYQADDAGSACGVCDACRIRRAGFVAAGIGDPTRYLQHA